MNTTSVRIEEELKHCDNWLHSLRLSIAYALSALKLRTSISTGHYTALPYQKKSMEQFPTVSNIHGISYGEKERDRLFY